MEDKGLSVWLEEFEEICKLNVETNSRELARRLLIFTEGFYLKVKQFTIEDLKNTEIQEILKKIRIKNMESMKNDKE